MTEARALPARAGAHVRHALHGDGRAWPETNCYLDLWIELLAAWGRDPLPLLGVGAGLSWEGDHFTFLKPSATEIVTLTGICVHELALWDAVEEHVAVQVGRGAIPLLEVDAFHLPDTASDAYRGRHTKTTIGVVALDPAANWLEYFHNAGLFRLSGEDYRGVLAEGALFPFAELARPVSPPPPEAARREEARAALARQAATRQAGNPVAAFGAALPELMARTQGEPDRVNALCFNTTRQLGGAFGLLADHLVWLGGEGGSAGLLADQAKVLQFQLARAARRGRPDAGLGGAIAEMATTWERCATEIDAACGAARSGRRPMAGAAATG